MTVAEEYGFYQDYLKKKLEKNAVVGGFCRNLCKLNQRMKRILNEQVETDKNKELTVSPECTIKITQKRAQREVIFLN